MRPSTALRLARSTASADRDRTMLVAAAAALVGALLLAAARVARLREGGDALADPVGSGDGLARFVTEPGLRSGYLLALALLAVPLLALALQALRVGSTSRDRRMASFRLAGATPADVRAVAAAEAGAAALVGGVVAGPLYVLLWLLAGVLPPTDFRLLPSPTPGDAAVWLGVVLLAVASGALAGAAVEGRAVVDPLGVRRRARRARPGRLNLAVLGIATACVLVGPSQVDSDASLVVGAFGLLVGAFAAGPLVVVLVGSQLSRRGPVQALMAGSRLLADPRSSGRVVAVLAICGFAFAVDAWLATSYLIDDYTDDDAFYLGGFGFAAAAIVLAAVVALVTLVVGAVDGLLDARRPLATLAAFGVDTQFLTRMLAVQLAAVAVPAVVAGALVGGALFAVAPALSFDEPALLPVLSSVVAAAAAGVLALLGALLVARGLSGQVRAATDPDNLRLA